MPQTAGTPDWRRSAVALAAVAVAICALLVTRAQMQQADAARELACLQRAQAESIVIGPGSMQMSTEDYKNRVAACR